MFLLTRAGAVGDGSGSGGGAVGSIKVDTMVAPSSSRSAMPSTSPPIAVPPPGHRGSSSHGDAAPVTARAGTATAAAAAGRGGGWTPTPYPAPSSSSAAAAAAAATTSDGDEMDAVAALQSLLSSSYAPRAPTPYQGISPGSRPRDLALSPGHAVGPTGHTPPLASNSGGGGAAAAGGDGGNGGGPSGRKRGKNTAPSVPAYQPKAYSGETAVRSGDIDVHTETEELPFPASGDLAKLLSMCVSDDGDGGCGYLTDLFDIGGPLASGKKAASTAAAPVVQLVAAPAPAKAPSGKRVTVKQER